MLDALAAPLLDHVGLDLACARRITYRLDQRFRYDYDAPIEGLRQRLVIVPRSQHGDLRLQAHTLTVSGAESRRLVRRDPDGNSVVHVRAPAVPRSVEFRLEAVLERVRADGPVRLPAEALRAPRLLAPTRLTGPDDAVQRLAAAAVGRGGRPLTVAERICALVHDAIGYEHGVTSVATTAAAALRLGRGVCQDSAHVMLAACRSVGIPARYVSGHLLGQGGTHAWVEVVVARRGGPVAVGFDPCNGRRTGDGHLTVAVGRDYADVAPTSGSYARGGAGRLSTVRSVGVTAIG